MRAQGDKRCCVNLPRLISCSLILEPAPAGGPALTLRRTGGDAMMVVWSVIAKLELCCAAAAELRRNRGFQEVRGASNFSALSVDLSL